MRYLISESQKRRIKKIIKNVAETFTNNYVKKTEVVVREEVDASGETYFIIHPTFYVQGAVGPDFHLLRHQLAQFVEDMVGVPVHGRSAQIKSF